MLPLQLLLHHCPQGFSPLGSLPIMQVQGGLPGEDQGDEPELVEHKVKVMLTQVVGESRACRGVSGSPQTPQCSTGSEEPQRRPPCPEPLFSHSLGQGDPMDDDRPLFTTFKPFGEDNTARAKPAPNTTPSQPKGAELPPGHHSRRGRVGHRDMKPGQKPCSPSLPALRGCILAGSRTSLVHVLT